MKADTHRLPPISVDALNKLGGLSNLMQKRRRESVGLPVEHGADGAKHAQRASDAERIIIVPFVGAGASASAGLPTSQQLKEAIWAKVVGANGGGEHHTEHRAASHASHGAATIEALFRSEAKAAFGKVPRFLTDLTLFELASILSVTQYGRDAIRACIRESLPSGLARPLSYELIAHLAKHDYIDDMVSLNFDTMLEQALTDELPDRIRVIDGSLEIPGDHSSLRAPKELRYLLKPFGSVDVDYFRLQPDELQHYGETSVWHFMLRHVFARDDFGDNAHSRRRTRGRSRGADTTVLLLVGYAAAEAAFSTLVRDLRTANPAGSIKIFSMNIREPSQELERLRQDRLINSLEWIHADADAGMTILLQMLEHRHGDHKPVAAWIPIARHEVLSACFPRAGVTNASKRALDETASPRTAEDAASKRSSDELSSKRFIAEVVLQAVKGRGFFTVESIADVHRIPVPPEGAGKALKRLIDHGLLRLHRGGALQRSAPKHLRADFELAERDNRRLASRLLQEVGLSGEVLVPDHRASLTPRGWAVKSRTISLVEFIADRFHTIGTAPQIEVSHDVSPATAWMFSRESHLRSVSALQEWTAQFLSEATKAKYVEITGIWVTGEWLFHPGGWAFAPFGERLIERALDGSAAIRVVLASFDEHMGTIRGTRAQEVNALLDPVMQRNAAPASLSASGDLSLGGHAPNWRSVRYLLDWWLHNRCVTLVRWGDSAAQLARHSGVYFRQRHGSPLVAPVALTTAPDCGVLEDLFTYYCRKAGSTLRESSVPLVLDPEYASGDGKNRSSRQRRRVVDQTSEYIVVKESDDTSTRRDDTQERRGRKGDDGESPMRH